MRRTQRNPDMVAEQSFRNTTPGTSQPASQFKHSVCQWSVQDALDVCNAEQNDDHFNFEFRAETL